MKLENVNFRNYQTNAGKIDGKSMQIGKNYQASTCAFKGKIPQALLDEYTKTILSMAEQNGINAKVLLSEISTSLSAKRKGAVKAAHSLQNMQGKLLSTIKECLADPTMFRNQGELCNAKHLKFYETLENLMENGDKKTADSLAEISNDILTNEKVSSIRLPMTKRGSKKGSPMYDIDPCLFGTSDKLYRFARGCTDCTLATALKNSIDSLGGSSKLQLSNVHSSAYYSSMDGYSRNAKEYIYPLLNSKLNPKEFIYTIKDSYYSKKVLEEIEALCRTGNSKNAGYLKISINDFELKDQAINGNPFQRAEMNFDMNASDEEFFKNFGHFECVNTENGKVRTVKDILVNAVRKMGGDADSLERYFDEIPSWQKELGYLGKVEVPKLLQGIRNMFAEQTSQKVAYPTIKETQENLIKSLDRLIMVQDKDTAKGFEKLIKEFKLGDEHKYGDINFKLGDLRVDCYDSHRALTNSVKGSDGTIRGILLNTLKKLGGGDPQEVLNAWYPKANCPDDFKKVVDLTPAKEAFARQQEKTQVNTSWRRDRRYGEPGWDTEAWFPERAVQPSYRTKL